MSPDVITDENLEELAEKRETMRRLWLILHARANTPIKTVSITGPHG